MNTTTTTKTEMPACRFSFDMSDGREWPGFAHGSTWNGFDNVAVTPATLAQMIEHFAAQGDECEELRELKPGEDGLVSLGWCFTTSIIAPSYVTVRTPAGKWLFGGPRAIVFRMKERVWVHASYADELPDEIVQVGDGRTNGYDEDGNCVISVPVEWVRHWLTEDEAQAVERCIDADQQMLGYAQ